MRIRISKNSYSDLYEFEKVPDDYDGVNEIIVDIPEEQADEWTKALTGFERMQMELMEANDKFNEALLEKEREEERGPLYKLFKKE
jgi:hypothetical protein